MNAQLLPLLPPESAPPVRADVPSCGELSAADGRPLPLKALSVETAIVGMTATSTVRQRFVNTGDTTIEATYVFPLPSRAGVTDFVADLAGRRVIGVLKERGEARAAYEQAIVAGQRAAIVEEDRSDVFSVRVGNIGPGEAATIEMRLTGPLPFEDGEATFRFPLVVAPRYTTGTPLPGDQTGSGQAADTDAVPDASRVTPPRLLDSEDRPDLDISLTVDGAGLAVSELRASLPTVVTAGDGPSVLRLEPGVRADQDFVLRFLVDRSGLSSSAVLVPDAEGHQGTWAVTVLPPAETSSAPRDVVVVLDRSGSMHGWKMIAARRAAGRIVDMLDARDRFCVLAFDDRIDTVPRLSAGLVEANDRNRFAAASWLGSLDSRGGTEMAEPLQRAVQLLSDSGAERQASVVLVTDGQITGEDQLLRTLAPTVGSTRIYCVGVDRAVNAGFLDRLAQLGTGRSELVESEERLDEVMARLARTIGRPALTGLRVRADGVELIDDTVTPSRLPDAFAGVPRVISGRYRGPGPATFRIEADGSTVATLDARIIPEAVAVQTIWARALVRDLEDDYAAYRADDELAAQIVAHSIRFGVLSRFTAFVAVDPSRTDAGPLDEVIQPVERPSGWAPTVGFAPTGMANSAACLAMPAPAVYSGPEARATRKPAPARLRPLDKLLKQVEKATQVRRSGLDAVLAELEQHRDAATEPDLHAALVQLCNALARFVKGQTQAQSREVLVAVDAVKRLLGGSDRGPRVRKLRFWE
ncbi:VIT domain-containing protein [Mycobacterium vicinigordonae]|uniref:VWA domain-containing protein n=1 Tax=Mycobacterium vicinigordonae TaxID=1719132 RepID=A0A7D6INU1_9MYCO|nr:VIT domain-containing protein [Mycobacterium vicinigordonae]QLL08480.1 VWA domain-containing protein [Mycobacterium vicinigordonae]